MSNQLTETDISIDSHLYTPVLYRAGDGTWHGDYLEAVKHTSGPLSWDLAALLSILCFNHACGDRTLLAQIRRKPWLSRIMPNGEPDLLPIPPHGRVGSAPKDIAGRLEALLCEEIAHACFGRDQVYLLLSGGLDSRVIAGVASKLAAEGRVESSLTAVTWGLSDSRDVMYGRATAELLDLNWTHLELGPEHLLENVEHAAQYASGLISPVHLHRMGWFEEVDSNALVLSGSYGDSVGRSELLGLHLLELQLLQPRNRYALMQPEAHSRAIGALWADIEFLRNRCGQRPEYALCELELHGHYTRGLLSHAMNIINRHCDIYQVFTSPTVYQYMWSQHPAFRTDAIYAILLERLHPRIARLPWSRTNRALRGRTIGADRTLRPKFHQYREWILGPAFAPLRKLVDPEWFEAAGLFCPKSVRQLIEKVRADEATHEDCALFAWLATLRRFAQLLEGCEKSPVAPDLQSLSTFCPERIGPHRKERSKLRARLGQSELLSGAYARLRTVRKWLLRRRALRRYPPEAEG